MKGIKKIRLSKCDKVWGQLIRESDQSCQYCGQENYLAAHHIYTRAIKATRLILENGITLCPAHHVFSSEFSAHKTPEKFKKWFANKWPTRLKIIKARLKTKITERQAIKDFVKKHDL